MKKKATLIFLIIIIIICFPFSISYAEETEEQINDNVDQELELVDWTSIEEYLTTITSKEGNIFSSSVKQTIKDIINGKTTISANTFLEFITSVFFGQLFNMLPQLITILVVCILCGIITRSKNTIIASSTNELIFFVCYGIIIIAVLVEVWKLINITRETIYNLKGLVNLIMPLLLTFMSAIGGKVSMQVYQPSIALFSGTIIEIVVNIILPLSIITIVFSLVSNLSNNIKLEKMAQFFKNISVAILGVVFTVFTSFLTVQGITASSIDTVSIRAAKFATRNYIPILGGYLSEGFDLIVASSMLIKNALGVVGLIFLLSIILSPIIQILVFNVTLQLVSAVCEPLTDNRIISFLSDISKNLTILIVSIIAVAFMFFIVTMLIICTANAI